jgi:hypothetical protein
VNFSGKRPPTERDLVQPSRPVFFFERFRKHRPIGREFEPCVCVEQTHSFRSIRTALFRRPAAVGSIVFAHIRQFLS